MTFNISKRFCRKSKFLVLFLKSLMGLLIIYLIKLTRLTRPVDGIGFLWYSDRSTTSPTFSVDYANNVFLLDGRPFHYIAGTLHYFRIPHQYWRDRLRKARAAGFNAISTCVEWGLHNPEPGEYLWDKDADLINFIETAAEEDLFILLKPGLFVADRDLDGHPAWLKSKYSTGGNSKPLQTNDERYQDEVKIWYSVLMKKIVPYLYSNGGPIIILELDSVHGGDNCDSTYKKWLRDLTVNYTGVSTVFFSSNSRQQVKTCWNLANVCNAIEVTEVNIKQLWKTTISGPLTLSFNSCNPLCWKDDRMRHMPLKTMEAYFYQMLFTNSSFIFHNFHGGTNFGFKSGYTFDASSGIYKYQQTSYGCDDFLDESGDPREKFFSISKIISGLVKLPNIPVPRITRKGNYGTVSVKAFASLISPSSMLGETSKDSVLPQSFDEMEQSDGLLLYETELPVAQTAVFNLRQLMGMAYIYLDNTLVQTLDRNSISMGLGAAEGSKLQILLENQGRAFSENMGIGPVEWGVRNIKNWINTVYSLENMDDMHFNENQNVLTEATSGLLKNGPVLYVGYFDIQEDELLDTYLDMRGWARGVAWINGHNLGRYRPKEGPQITLFVPGVYLKVKNNEIIILELEHTRDDLKIYFTDKNLFYKLDIIEEF